MNELYEQICRYINWSEKTDTDTIKFNLMQDYTKEQIGEARKYASSLLEKLRKVSIENVVAEYNGYYGDSVHDFMCELVAHGEEYVDSLIANPKIALERFKKGDYNENFFYCFPYDEDWENLSADKHIKRANDGLKYVKEARKKYGEKYLPSYMEKKGGYDFDLAEEVMTEIKNLRFNSNRDYDTVYHRTENLGHHAYFANIWSDFGKSYAKLHPECVIGDGEYRGYPEKVEINS